MADDTKRLNVVISADLHKELKVEVVKNGSTIGQFVAEAIAEKIARQRGGNN
jgi:predicted HicB family RNase H-like nuclease